MNLTLYYSNDCGHCRLFLKTVEKIGQERPNVRVSRVEYKPAEHTEVKFIPTIVVTYGEIELGRFSSALSKNTIDNWLDQLEDYINTFLGV